MLLAFRVGSGETSMSSNRSTMRVDRELCSGCGACVEACSHGALYLIDGVAQVDPDLCTGCEACLAVCPSSALIKCVTGEIVAPIAESRVARPAPDAVHVSPQKAVSVAGLAAAAGLVARKAIPWIVDVLLTRLEKGRYPARPSATTDRTSRGTPSGDVRVAFRGQHRRRHGPRHPS